MNNTKIRETWTLLKQGDTWTLLKQMKIYALLKYGETWAILKQVYIQALLIQGPACKNKEEFWYGIIFEDYHSLNLPHFATFFRIEKY